MEFNDEEENDNDDDDVPLDGDADEEEVAFNGCPRTATTKKGKIKKSFYRKRENIKKKTISDSKFFLTFSFLNEDIH